MSDNVVKRKKKRVVTAYGRKKKRLQRNFKSTKGTSTSGSSFRNNITNESLYTDTDENDDQEYLEGADEEEIDYKPFTTDTMIIEPTSSYVPNRINPVEANVNQYPTTLECDLFGELISKHLQGLPLQVGLKLQRDIHELVMKTRLEYARQNPDEAPPMIKQEVREDEEIDETPRTPNDDSRRIQDNQANKRTIELVPPEAKRLKSTNSKPSVPPSRPKETKTKRTECFVFAEQIAVQLEQLPEELALQLQSEIYAIISQTVPELNKDNPPGGIRIKTEGIDVSPTQITNEDYDD